MAALEISNPTMDVEKMVAKTDHEIEPDLAKKFKHDEVQSEWRLRSICPSSSSFRII